MFTSFVRIVEDTVVAHMLEPIFGKKVHERLR
jgi:hypothetical protein